MSESHEHYCKKCNLKYSCTADRPIDASDRMGPADSVCFHHYGVPHDSCTADGTAKDRVVAGGE